MILHSIERSVNNELGDDIVKFYHRLVKRVNFFSELSLWRSKFTSYLKSKFYFCLSYTFHSININVRASKFTHYHLDVVALINIGRQNTYTIVYKTWQSNFYLDSDQTLPESLQWVN